LFSRRKVITFEILERSYYRVPEVELRSKQCDYCGFEVRWLTPNQTLALSGLTLREIFRRIESNEVHINEAANGLLQICPNSIQLR